MMAERSERAFPVPFSDYNNIDNMYVGKYYLGFVFHTEVERIIHFLNFILTIYFRCLLARGLGHWIS